MKPALTSRVRCGDFEIDLAAGEICTPDRRVLLQQQPLRVLKILIGNAGNVVTRDEIKFELWPNDTVVEFDNAINTAIRKLRTVFSDSPDQPKYIETVARRGYRFIMPVMTVDPSAEPPPAAGAQAGSPEAVSPLPSLSTGMTGRTVSHYRVLEVIGGGGMGVVYRAEDLKLGRAVALKFLPEDLGSDSWALERFSREARSASSLDHSNICSIHEFGEHDGHPFIVMPLLEGQTLRDRLATSTGPLSLNESLDIAIQVAQGLRAAHERGIIHRDIKPANIFITTKGVCKILDFGVAKLLEAAEPEEAMETGGFSSSSASQHPVSLTLTRTGIAMGTAGYMSPEQIRGEKLDARTDIFSFGLVLYEMTTGMRAYPSESAAQAQSAILHNVATPIAQLNPRLPAKLISVIDKALEKEREKRYQSAAEMASDLNNAMGSARKKKFTRVQFAGFAAVLIVLAAIAWRVYVSAAHPAVGDLPRFKIIMLTGEGNFLEPAAMSPDGKFIVYQKKAGGKAALWLQQIGNPSALKITPDLTSSTLDDVSFSPDGSLLFYELRDRRSSDTFLYRVPALGGTPVLFGSEAVGAVGFSSDGSRLAYKQRGDDGGVQLMVANANGSEPRVLYTGDKHMREIFTAPAWSPDGKWIAISERVPRGQGGYATISLIDLAGHRRELTGDHQIDIAKLAWLPDGSAIIFTGNPQSSQPQQIYTARCSDGRITRITGDSAAYFVRALNLTADGNSIFAVHRYDISSLWLTGQNPGQARQLSMEDMVPQPQSFGLDGQRVFYYSTVGQSDGIWRSDLRGGAPVRITPADVSAANISLSSDGHWIAFNAIADGRRSIWIADTDGKSPRQLADGSFPLFTVDGKEVIFFRQGKDPGLYRVSSSGGPAVRVSDLPLGIPSSTRADGYVLCQYFESKGSRRRMAVVSLHDGRLIRVFDEPDWVSRPQFTRDGKNITYIDDKDGSSNIWSIPFNGGTPRKLTNFTSDDIVEYAWSLDGKRLLLARGSLRGMAVLIQNFK